MYNALEKLVSAESWYEGGYRAQIVTYAIAKLAYDLRVRGKHLDFDLVWKAQDLPPGLRESLRKATISVKDILTNPAQGYANVTEWAKQPACWTRVQNIQMEWSTSLATCLVSSDEVKTEVRSARRDQKEVDGIHAQVKVVDAGHQFWKNLSQWARSHKLLSQKELEIIDIAGHSIPSDRQSIIVLQALKRAQDDGFPMRLKPAT
jgi:hypothetical protein